MIESRGVDAIVRRDLSDANVLEHVWDLALLQCYEVFGAQDKTQEMINLMWEQFLWLIQLQNTEQESMDPTMITAEVEPF